MNRASSTYRHPTKMNHCRHRTTRPLIGLWLALLFMPGLSRAVDETFALVETKTAVYSNVTVTTKSEGYIVIQHAMGLASLNVSELPPEVLQALGYGAGAAPKNGGFTITAKARALVAAIPTEKIKQTWSRHAPAGTPPLTLNPTIIYAALGVFAALYLLFCFCGSLICQKAGKPAGLLICLPVLQYIPLLRAANMSPLWLLAMFVPVLNLVAHFLWSFRIAGVRGQGFFTAILLFLPTFPLAFMYLAFAGGSPPSVDGVAPQKFRASGLMFD